MMLRNKHPLVLHYFLLSKESNSGIPRVLYADTVAIFSTELTY